MPIVVIELWREGRRYHWRLVQISVMQPSRDQKRLVLVAGSTGDFDSALRAAKSEYDKEVS